MRTILAIFSISLLFGCEHFPGKGGRVSEASVPQPEKEPEPCAAWLSAYGAMSSKELRGEQERLVRAGSDKDDSSALRQAALTGMLALKNKNYPRAQEVLSPLSNKRALDEACRQSLKVYTDLVEQVVEADARLQAERREKSELERKLRALSEIEKDIGRRGKRAN